MDRHIRLHGWLVKLGRIDVNLDLECARRKGLPVVAGLADIESRSQDQQQIGILYRKIPRPIADRALASTKEGIVGSNEVVGPRGRDWHTKAVTKGVKFIDCMSGADARAREDYGTLGVANAIENLAALRRKPRAVGEAVTMAVVVSGIVTPKACGINGRGLYVHGNIKPARSRAATLRQVPGALQMIANGEGIIDEGCVLGDAANHGDNVGFLVPELAQSGKTARAHASFAFYLARDHEHGDGVGPGAKDAVKRSEE